MKDVIEIRPQGEKLVWKQAEDIKTNTEVLAREGTQGIVMHDGSVLMQVMPGKRVTINEKKLFERKIGGAYELYGVNTGKLITLNWGTSSSPEYKDESFGGANLKVMCHGQCLARIEEAQTLFNLMIASKTELTEEALKEYIKDKLRAVCVETVAAVANELRKKSAIEAARSRISDEMKERVSKSFLNTYGLHVEDSVVMGITVSGAEKIGETENKIILEELQTRLSDESKKQALNEVEVVKSLNEATAPKKSVDNQEKKAAETKQARPQPQAKDFKFCVDCGKKLPLDAKFCSDCGRRQ